MAETASLWEQLALQKPRLRSGLTATVQQYAGKPWYVISDPLTGRHYRFSPSAQGIIAGMDGHRSVANLCRPWFDRQQDLQQQRNAVMQLLARMYTAELLDWDPPPAVGALLEQSGGGESSDSSGRKVNPLVFRLPLADPDAWLTRTLIRVRPLFSAPALLLWCLLVAWGGLQAAMHWPALSDNLADKVLTSSNLLLLWLSFPVVKLLHELGHAFAVKVRGGEVHEMGVMLLALVPVPYVDASAANGFAARRDRVLVGTAGVMVDLAVAALALQVWLLAAPGGLLHALCYNLMLITFLSALFFNANPLMRFDGYYVLSDVLGIPNLAGRAGRYLLYLLQRYAFGLSTLRSPAHSSQEARWFAAYGIGAFVYRLFVLALILWFVSDKYLLLGVIIAIWGGSLVLLRPLLAGLRGLLFGPLLAQVRGRALAISGGFAITLCLLLFVAPVPAWTQAEAVVWLPEKAVVRAGADGFIRAFMATPGGRVEQGAALVRSEDPLAGARLARLEARVAELRARYTALRSRDRAEAARVQDVLRSARAELERARSEFDRLVIYSETAGRFELRDGEDLIGRFVRKGEVIGYVVGTLQPRLRAVVAQDDIGRVRADAQRLRARLLEHTAGLVPVRLLQAVPAAGHRLPSAALGTAGGGAVPVDPADSSGRTALAPVFIVELELPPGASAHPGARARVRFEHSRAPLGQRWYRQLRAKINQRMAG